MLKIKIMTAVVFGVAISFFTGPAKAVLFVCTYCSENGDLIASAPPSDGPDRDHRLGNLW